MSYLSFPPEVVALLDRPVASALGPGEPDADACRLVAGLTPARLFGGRAVRDEDAAKCCLSALWLRFNDLDRSHSLSQGIETAEGSAWHAIMHRREPDAWNSKYWWRRVGPHPFLDELRAQAPALGYRYTTPEAFVDFCERARGAGTADEALALRVQDREWRLLFDLCARLAIGNEP